MSGELLSIGKDLNFIIVFDKHSIDNFNGIKVNPLNAAKIYNMFNEN